MTEKEARAVGALNRPTGGRQRKKPKGSEEREGGVLGRKGRPSGEKLETKPPTYLDHRFELRAEVRHVERLLVDDVRRRVGA